MRIPSIVLLLLAGCGDPSSLENFHEVRSGLFRGGHPDTSSFAFLESMGVKTIVDLEIDNGVEADGDDITQELTDAANADITVLRFPMSAFDSPDDEFDRMIDRIMTVLADPSLGPITCIVHMVRTEPGSSSRSSASSTKAGPRRPRTTKCSRSVSTRFSSGSTTIMRRRRAGKIEALARTTR